MDDPSPQPTMCQENLRKQGDTQNELKTPQNLETSKLKPIWSLGTKVSKIQ